MHVESLTALIDVHLTNVAVQKTAPDYDPEKGSKWSVRQLRLYLTARHGQLLVSIIIIIISSSSSSASLCLVV